MMILRSGVQLDKSGAKLVPGPRAAARLELQRLELIEMSRDSLSQGGRMQIAQRMLNPSFYLASIMLLTRS